METLQSIIKKQNSYEVEHYELFNRPNHIYQCNYHMLKNITFWHYVGNNDEFFKEHTVGVWRIKYKSDAQ